MIKAHCTGWQDGSAAKSMSASTDGRAPSLSVSSDLDTHACTARAQLTSCPPPYLATEGIFLRPDHIAHHVAEVHAIGKLVGPSLVKLGVLVQLGQQVLICCFLKKKSTLRKWGPSS